MHTASGKKPQPCPTLSPSLSKCSFYVLPKNCQQSKSGAFRHSDRSWKLTVVNIPSHLPFSSILWGLWLVKKTVHIHILASSAQPRQTLTGEDSAVSKSKDFICHIQSITYIMCDCTFEALNCARNWQVRFLQLSYAIQILVSSCRQAVFV